VLKTTIIEKRLCKIDQVDVWRDGGTSSDDGVIDVLIEAYGNSGTAALVS
jgi:hypothetical protein